MYELKMDFDLKSAKSRKQIANEYGICTKTLTKWLKDEKIRLKRGLINPKKQDLIYKRFGFPHNFH
jgi:abortive infection bacteriophage resistance protein